MARCFLHSSIVAALSLAASSAGVLDDLNAADTEKIRAGKTIVLTEDVEGMPWPRVTVYRATACSAAETMAVFFDYDNAVNYVPNCLKSKISKRLGPRTVEVDYEVDVPILADEAYTARNELSGDLAGVMTVSWELLRATSVVRSEGELTVEPMGEGAIVRYRNFVELSSIAAGLLRRVAIGQMEDMLDSLLDQVEEQRRERPEELAGQVQMLEDAWGR